MLPFIQHTLVKPFSEVFTHSVSDFSMILSNSMGIAAISARILSCCASRVEYRTFIFSDICCEGHGRRSECDMVYRFNVKGEGGGRFVFMDMLERVNANFRKRFHQCNENEMK